MARAIRGSAPLVAVIVGLIVLLGSAAAGFAMAGGFSRTVGRSVPCGVGDTCIPAHTTSEVAGALQAKGFGCEPRPGAGGHRCALSVGANSYELVLDPSLDDPEQIRQVILVARFPQVEGQPTRGVRAYLEWFATLPFAGLPTVATDVTTWLNEQIDGGQDAQAAIGGYEYELKASQPGLIELTLKGEFQP